jgi:methyl-accepting chemotaxis protein
MLGLSPRLQFTMIFLSLVGVAFGFKSLWHVRTAFGDVASEPFYWDIIVQITIALAINILSGVLIYRTVTKPIHRINDTMEALTNDDLEVEIPYIDKMDEIGQMARTVQVFKENALRIKELEEEQERTKKATELERKTLMDQIAEEFDVTVKGISDVVSKTASLIDEASKGMSTSTDSNTQKIMELKDVFLQATQNVSTVAKAAEELASSISEISKQANHSSTIAHAASKEAEKANITIQGLSEAAKRINEVVGLINELAEQINLLALNATIEAARAGEAGKGFDVVASEVKNLSRQTESATEEIAKYVTSIQQETNNAVEVINLLSKRIEDISSVATNISSAVEEQNASTREIARNIQQAASNTTRVKTEVDDVANISKKTGGDAKEMMMATTELIRQSDSLNKEVSRFLQKMRAA